MQLPLLCRHGPVLASNNIGCLVARCQRSSFFVPSPGYVKFKSTVKSPIKSTIKSSSNITPYTAGRFAGPRWEDEKKQMTGKQRLYVATQGSYDQQEADVIKENYDKPVHRDIMLGPVWPYPDNNLASTRPAPLDSPEAPVADDHGGSIPIKTRASYLFRLGKAYLTFYKTGMKNIWANWKQMRQIQARLGGLPLDHVAQFGGQPLKTGSAVEEDMSRMPQITRKEYQLVTRTQHDLWKLAPFGLIFCIFGEFTPLVIVLLGSSVVPYTCRIPKQVTHDHERPFRIAQRHQEAVALAEQAQSTLEAQPSYRPNERDRFATTMRIHYIAAHEFGIQPFPTPLPVIGKLWWRIFEPRLAKLGSQILCDMILIRREGGFSRLEPIEVFNCALAYRNRDCLKELYERKHNGIDIDPMSQELKDLFIPWLERQVDHNLNHDFKRIPIEQRWNLLFVN